MKPETAIGHIGQLTLKGHSLGTQDAEVSKPKTIMLCSAKSYKITQTTYVYNKYK